MKYTKYVMEVGVLLVDKEIFGDSNEHSYKVKCFDGYAIAEKEEKSDDAPSTLELTYPRLAEIDNHLKKNILQYRGLYDLGCEDVTYGDVMMYFGKIKK